MRIKSALVGLSFIASSASMASPDKEIISMLDLARDMEAITLYDHKLATEVIKEKREAGLCKVNKPCYEPQFITDLILGNSTFHEKSFVDSFLDGFFEDEKDTIKEIKDKVKDVGRTIRKKFNENQRKRAEGIAENYKPHTKAAKERERRRRIKEHNKLIEAKLGTGV